MRIQDKMRKDQLVKENYRIDSIGKSLMHF